MAEILKVSRRTQQEYRNDGVIPYVLLGGKVLYRERYVKRNRLLTTELALCAVNRHPAHNGYYTILLLTLVHIEQNVKSTSHVSFPVLPLFQAELR